MGTTNVTEKINNLNLISNETKKSLDSNYKLIFSEDQNNPFLNKIKNLYRELTLDLGKNWHPYVNGRYMIFMESGPWLSSLKDVNENQQIFSNYSKILFQNNQIFDIYPKLATDIDLPQINNEYLTVSTRNQGITYFHRQTMLPDFSISYIENHKNLDIIQYHDLWFKMMELYRRGEINYTTTKSGCKYFYEVPYLNAVWVIIFDIAFQIRGLIYLVGVKPINHPLKEFLGNRSNSKITVYNIQYKTTNMYYNFFANTKDFIEEFNNNKKNILMTRFKSFVNKIAGNNTTNTANIANATKTTQDAVNTVPKTTSTNFDPASDGYGYG